MLRCLMLLLLLLMLLLRLALLLLLLCILSLIIARSVASEVLALEKVFLNHLRVLCCLLVSL